MQIVPSNVILMLMSGPYFNSGRSASSRSQHSGISNVNSFHWSISYFEDSRITLGWTTCRDTLPMQLLAFQRVSSQQERSAMEEWKSQFRLKNDCQFLFQNVLGIIYWGP